MRGGLTYDQAMALSNDERRLISELIKDNLETTKKSGLPFFWLHTYKRDLLRKSMRFARRSRMFLFKLQ